MHFWYNYHRSDALRFSFHPFRGTWFQCILLPIMFTLTTWLRLSTVRSLFFPLVILGTPFAFGMDSNALHQAVHLWTPSSPRMDNLLIPFRLWHPILGHSHVWMSCSPYLGPDIRAKPLLRTDVLSYPAMALPLLQGGPFTWAPAPYGRCPLWQDTLHLGSDIPC